ncbi:hypothetical protein T310_2332 [Rasamsonia emersonii CBS 393.64]|uniref:Uncharacterized protein n=1 Tax=Rasamsonia emersonii (strain ATCC 16479 / CBS 393.64 / IMI 116815) TaxID=1408163 RepID=A0A0F4YZJ9_RASE3|nr:hypothetical protein T310_2332 [Rasamsonia emersonii CBS 393.64]KKA23654.1 hypothetical protein T310_2332 [Rasamsonia emersonii CBS 393.64]
MKVSFLFSDCSYYNTRERGREADSQLSEESQESQDYSILFYSILLFIRSLRRQTGKYLPKYNSTVVIVIVIVMHLTDLTAVLRNYEVSTYSVLVFD